MISYSGSSFELRTERLVLRPFVEGDVAAYAAMNADPEVMRWLGGPRPLEQTRAEMQGGNDSLAREGFGKVAIERAADGQFLGMCGLSLEAWASPDYLEIGWRLAPQFQGQGLVTEAARAWLDYGFATLGLEHVISVADVPNVKSIAVMQRLGMTLEYEGELEVEGDRFLGVIYGIERGDWK